MAERNLADPEYEPSDEDFAELLGHAGADARERCARAERLLWERIHAERVRLGILPAETPKVA